MKYKKKPVVIEAIQWVGDNLNEIESFVGENMLSDNDGIEICTLEGNMKASKGDYIIKGIKGEFYPCKPDIFDATYEIVEEDGGKINE